MTKIVNLYKEPFDVYIGRAGKGKDGYFGNPVPLRVGEVPGDTLERFKEYFENRIKVDLGFKKRVEDLKGKTLGCFCKPKPCHGDIYVEYLNSLI